MFSICKKMLAYGAAALITLPSVAFANDGTHYTGNWDGLGLGYNPFTETLSMNYSDFGAAHQNQAGEDINSYWLVVTDGPMPMNGLSVQLIADIEENKITAYSYNAAYNKDNAVASSKNYLEGGDGGGQHLHTYHVDDLENGFRIDASIVNDALAELDPSAHFISVDEDNNKVGIWMNGGNGTPEYNQDGSIASWKTGDGDYHIYDKHGLDVTPHTSLSTPPPPRSNTPVSEPAAILALLAAAGMMRIRRKKDV